MQGNVPHKVELRERHDAIDAEKCLAAEKMQRGYQEKPNNFKFDFFGRGYPM